MLFNSFVFYMYDESSDVPYYLIMSMSVLIYKLKCREVTSKMKVSFCPTLYEGGGHLQLSSLLCRQVLSAVKRLDTTPLRLQFRG